MATPYELAGAPVIGTKTNVERLGIIIAASGRGAEVIHSLPKDFADVLRVRIIPDSMAQQFSLGGSSAGAGVDANEADAIINQFQNNLHISPRHQPSTTSSNGSPAVYSQQQLNDNKSMPITPVPSMDISGQASSTSAEPPKRPPRRAPVQPRRVPSQPHSQSADYGYGGPSGDVSSYSSPSGGSFAAGGPNAGGESPVPSHSGGGNTAAHPRSLTGAASSSALPSTWTWWPLNSDATDDEVLYDPQTVLAPEVTNPTAANPGSPTMRPDQLPLKIGYDGTPVVRFARRTARGVSLRVLTNYLTAPEDEYDYEFVTDFLNSYRFFVDGVDVLRLMIIRYLNGCAANPAPSMLAQHYGSNASALYGGAHGHTRYPPEVVERESRIQQRVLDFVRRWLEEFYEDFKMSRHLTELFLHFIEFIREDTRRGQYIQHVTSVLRNGIESRARNRRHGHGSGGSGSGNGAAGSTMSDLSSLSTLPQFRLFGGEVAETLLDEMRAVDERAESGSATSGGSGQKRAGGSIASSSGGGGGSSFLGLFKKKSEASRLSANQGNGGNAKTGYAGGYSGSKHTNGIMIRLVQMDPSSPSIEVEQKEFAHNLTLLEHRMFRTASATELCFHSRCSDPVSRAKYTPRLFEFAGWFNRVAYWVARQVVTHEDHNERVKLVQTFIMVAHQCMVWHNYNTCFEIVTGLMLSPVQRLTSTWAKVSSKYQQMLDQLHTIMSQRPNFKLYRGCLRGVLELSGVEGEEALEGHIQRQRQMFDHTTTELQVETLAASRAGHDIPVIPFLAVHLTDLLYADEGNVSYIEANRERDLRVTLQKAIQQLAHNYYCQQVLQTTRQQQSQAVAWSSVKAAAIQHMQQQGIGAPPMAPESPYARGGPGGYQAALPTPPPTSTLLRSQGSGNEFDSFASANGSANYRQSTISGPGGSPSMMSYGSAGANNRNVLGGTNITPSQSEPGSTLPQPSKWSTMPLINFGKFRMMNMMLHRLLASQRTRYSTFRNDPHLQYWIISEISQVRPAGVTGAASIASSSLQSGMGRSNISGTYSNGTSLSQFQYGDHSGHHGQQGQQGQQQRHGMNSQNSFGPSGTDQIADMDTWLQSMSQYIEPSTKGFEGNMFKK